jgi:bleomycin hydrolase
VYDGGPRTRGFEEGDMPLKSWTVLAVVLTILCGPTAAQHRDVVVYVEEPKDAVLVHIEERDEALRKAAEEKTAEIIAAVTKERKAREEALPKLRFDLSRVKRPESPEAFATTHWHFPPTPQYMTGACWSFSATSFFESEIRRTTGQEIKLSEMWTVYWEFVNKARGFVANRGETLFDHGSQSAALIRVYREHGVVPRADYEGVINEDGLFDHDIMHEQMMSFLEWCRDANFWDEDIIVAMVRRLLDATMGRPPESINWRGLEMDPRSFLEEVCQLELDDYVDVMSTLSKPFWVRDVYEVPDNWWRGAGYLNVPLDTWYDIIVRTMKRGGSLVIGGDVSEPGLNGFEDVAVVPTFDIPGEYIDQSAREYRFFNTSSTDDHGIHMVGHTVVDNHDWFLIKDSNRSSRAGRFEGYYMYRDDYVKLKMLTIMVHKDQVREILEKVGDS